MPSITDALALHDTASGIDRLQFQLRALPPAPAIPSLTDVSAHVQTLAGLTSGITVEINRRLSAGLFSVPAQRAVEAYSSALAPLGEAMTELGRLQHEIAFVNFTAPRISQSDLPYPRQMANEIITGCREAADDILTVAADELRAAANRLTPSSPHTPAAARARSPHTPIAAYTALASDGPPSPAPPPAAAPSTAKTR
jgi:hypothetical protein